MSRDFTRDRVSQYRVHQFHSFSIIVRVQGPRVLNLTLTVQAEESIGRHRHLGTISLSAHSTDLSPSSLESARLNGSPPRTSS